MKKLSILSLFFSISVIASAPIPGFTQALGGNGLGSTGSPRAVTIQSNLLYLGMNLTYLQAAAYYQTEDKCAPAGTFQKAPEQGAGIIASITNDDQCAIVGQFGPNAAGPLQNQYVRILPMKKGKTTDFKFQLCATSVDSADNNSQSMLKTPLPSFFSSPILQSSSFGNCATVSSSLVLTINYTDLASKAGASSGTSGQSNATIG